jgi:hypothetical protein
MTASPPPKFSKITVLTEVVAPALVEISVRSPRTGRLYLDIDDETNDALAAAVMIGEAFSGSAVPVAKALLLHHGPLSLVAVASGADHEAPHVCSCIALLSHPPDWVVERAVGIAQRRGHAESARVMLCSAAAAGHADGSSTERGHVRPEPDERAAAGEAPPRSRRRSTRSRSASRSRSRSSSQGRTVRIDHCGVRVGTGRLAATRNVLRRMMSAVSSKGGTLAALQGRVGNKQTRAADAAQSGRAPPGGNGEPSNPASPRHLGMRDTAL